MYKYLFIFTLLLFLFPLTSLSTTTVLPDNSKAIQNFWASGYKAEWVTQTQAKDWEQGLTNGMKINDGDEYFDVRGENEVVVTTRFKNTGTETWYNAPEDRQVCIAIYKDQKVKSSWNGKENVGESNFKSASWSSPYRIGCVQEDSVKPGDTGTFILSFSIPQDSPSGRFREDITVSAGNYWMESESTTADPIGAAHIWVGFDIFGYQETTTVSRVVDGDTIVLADGRKVRYVGIDTPETVDPDKPVQCYGKDASNKNKELVEGKTITLVGDPTSDNVDKYNRIIRYIYLPNQNQSVNMQLVREGYAFAYTKYPNHLKQLFVEEEKKAQSENKGFWGVCDVAVPTPVPTFSGSCANANTKYCSTTITSCDEAKYLLQVCGLSRLDADSDGVPCENLCG